MLVKKLTLNLERGHIPNVKVNYRDGERTQQSLRREYLLHRALIEAVGGDKDKARELLTELIGIEEAGRREASSLFCSRGKARISFTTPTNSDTTTRYADA